MIQFRNLALLLFFLLTTQNVFAQTDSQPVKITDMLKIRNVNQITLSKDGTMAAFTVTSIEPEEKNPKEHVYLTQIYMIYLNGNGRPVQMTTSRDGASQPAWSPDGKQLAFTRRAGDKSQIFILPITGGEPFQLTSGKYNASNPVWSPDGKHILYSSSVSFQDLLKDSSLRLAGSVPPWPLEKPGFKDNEFLLNSGARPDPDGNLAQIRAYLDSNEANRKALVMNKLNFQSESGLSSDMNFNQFFLIEAKKESSPILLTKGFYQYSQANFTPDGKQIVFSGSVDSLQNPDRSLESQIYISDITGNRMKMLLGEKGRRFGNAAISPSGKWLAFIHGPALKVSVPELSIMPLNGTFEDRINIPFDRSKGSLTWSRDNKYLYFTSQSNGGTILCRFDTDTKKIETLSDFDAGINSFDVGEKTILYAQTAVSNPSELFTADLAFKNNKQVSDFNAWVKTRKLSFPEKKTFRNNQGMEVEYWVMKPADFRPGKKYPLLLEIHGGPSAMWGPGEASMWHEYQYFCSQGYGVVYSNPRGSGGYGEAFLRANINDWSKGPASDVLTALDNAVAEGWADTSKLLITGGSYAGYLTAWIIAHDKRFAAACSQRGVYDLPTFFGEGNAWRLLPLYFGGYPWQPEVKEVLVRESPVNYVQQITTPYIIFHGANDRRTGFVQAEMMFRSLKVLNRPVEFVVHPGATHEITRSGNNRQRIDQLLRTYEFFQRWIDKE